MDVSEHFARFIHPFDGYGKEMFLCLLRITYYFTK